jgi:hypothetical protein
MRTYCRLLVLIDSSCADFMHTNSVLFRLCRPRAYIKQSKCVSFQFSSATGGGPSPCSSRAKEKRWRCFGCRHRRLLRPFGRGGSSVGCRRPFGQSGGGCRHHHDFLERSAVVSRPSGTATAGCGGCKTRRGASGAGGQWLADMRWGC